MHSLPEQIDAENVLMKHIGSSFRELYQIYFPLQFVGHGRAGRCSTHGHGTGGGEHGEDT